MFVIQKTHENILGVALAMGCLTTLRFSGLFGLSELLFLFFVFLSILKYGKDIGRLPRGYYGYSLYMLVFFLVFVAPVVTLINIVFYGYNVTPIYVPSYIFSVLLLFTMVNRLRVGMDMKHTTLVFASIFLAVHLFYVVTGKGYVNGRLLALSLNPNQIYFYGSCLLLMAAIYAEKWRYLIVPLTVFILLENGSDSFKVTLVLVPLSFILFKVFFGTRLGFKKSIVLLFLIAAISLPMLINIYGDQLMSLWYLADEGGQRISLLTNALIVSLNSPIIGYGIGSYSGLVPYGTTEAHNTFLDFSMQFGFIVPLIIYFIFFGYLFKSIQTRNYFVASLVVSFIVSGLFHFNGRHFFFWIELSIFYYVLLYGRA